MPEHTVAIVFDATSRQYSILSDRKVLGGFEEGSLVDYDGRQLLVVGHCRTSSDAKIRCEELTASLSQTGLGVHSGQSSSIISIDSDSTEEMVSFTGEATPESAVNESIEVDRYRQESCEPPMNFDSVGIVRDILQNLLHEMTEDVSRINRRFQEIRQILIRYYGTAPDGSIVNNFEEHPSSLILGGDLSPSRSLLTRREPNYVRKPHRPNYFDRLVQQEIKRKAAKRAFDTDEYLEEQVPSSRRDNQIGRAGDVLLYPFVPREEEERILSEADGSFAYYAQHLSRVLFADTLHLYFKDQDIHKRQWLHEAIDFRFPAPDRAAHLQKWKNCSYYINKNMNNAREKKGQRSPEINFKYLSAEVEQNCLDRSSGDAMKYAESMAFHLFSDSLDKFFKEQNPKMKEWLRSCVDKRFPINDKLKRDQRWKVCAVACNRNRTKVVGSNGYEEPYPYFSKEIEEDCFKKSKGNPVVYCEMMCDHLFPDSKHLYFKDRDLGKRNWLHDILDMRFPTKDKIAHVAKWKSCTAAANKLVTAELLRNENKPMDKNENKPMDKNENKPMESRSKKDEPAKNDKEAKEKKRIENLPLIPSPPASVSGSLKRSSRRSVEKQIVVISNGKSYSKRARKEDSRFGIENYITEEEEAECWDNSKGNIQVYARNVGRYILRESLKLNFKDQEEIKKKWIREVIQWRFPNIDLNEESRQWRAIVASVNKNTSLR